jgi:hypothetical protein
MAIAVTKIPINLAITADPVGPRNAYIRSIYLRVAHVMAITMRIDGIATSTPGDRGVAMEVVVVPSPISYGKAIGTARHHPQSRNVAQSSPLSRSSIDRRSKRMPPAIMKLNRDIPNRDY